MKLAAIIVGLLLCGCAAHKPVKAKLMPNQANCTIEAVNAKTKQPSAIHCLWGDGSDSFWVRQ